MRKIAVVVFALIALSSCSDEEFTGRIRWQVLAAGDISRACQTVGGAIVTWEISDGQFGTLPCDEGNGQHAYQIGPGDYTVEMKLLDSLNQTLKSCNFALNIVDQFMDLNCDFNFLNG